jgi:hypothetical protein
VIVPMHRNGGLVLNACSEALFHPALMLFLDAPQTLGGEGRRLSVDPLVVDVAQKDQVLVPIPFCGSHERIAPRAGRTCSDDVRHVSERHGRLTRARIDDEQATTFCEGAAVARSCEQTLEFSGRDAHAFSSGGDPPRRSGFGCRSPRS